MVLHAMDRPCSELKERTTNINAWCSHTVKVNLKLLGKRCRAHYHPHLVAVIYVHPDADSEDSLRVYVYNYINCIHVL